MKQVAIHKVLVTGANGQLGWELAQASKTFPQFEFVFVDRNAMDLSNPAELEGIVTLFAPDAIINTAAYTAVDKAETETALAHTINAEAVSTLALIAKQRNIPFITYSTDYVFNGNATSPYLTDTALEPVNFYGKTKADGELLAAKANPDTIIIRTSWVFSSHGNNFVITMMRLMKERDALNIVGDQKGRPTFAKDLAFATINILEAINEGKTIKGIYHYANAGETTWFGFAEKIKALANLECDLTAITSDKFPTPAKRPAYSVLDTHKIEKDLGIEIPSWESALAQCIHQLNNA
jgi:dTDP-4-dehydrorhamnose reductase